MLFFKDREFDPTGLVEVILNIVFSLLAIIIAIFFLVVCATHPAIVGLCLVGGMLFVLIWTGVKIAFNLIFPKKVDKEKKMKELNDWLHSAKNAFEGDEEE